MTKQKAAKAASEEEAILNAPDLNEGEMDVEHYTLPSSDGITDPYLKKVVEIARQDFDAIASEEPEPETVEEPGEDI